MGVKAIFKQITSKNRYYENQRKEQRKVDRAKDNMARNMAKVLVNIKPEIIYHWGDFQLKDYTGYNDHEESWKITEKVYDALVAAGFEVEVKKLFSGFHDEPKWYWQLNVVVPELKDETYNKWIHIRMGWAERDPDCVPQQQVHVSKSWTCIKP